MSRSIRWAEVREPSNDRGPHKLAELVADGKRMTAHVIEPYGFFSSPIKKGLAVVMIPDGDEGKAVAVMLPPPAERVDGLKEGELMLKNLIAGQFMKFDADGHCTLELPGNLTIKAGGDIVTEAGGTITDKSPKWVYEGQDMALGGADASRKLSCDGTVDTCGCADSSNFSTVVRTK